MFESDDEEMRTGKMTITDFSVEAVEEFLRDFYTRVLPSVTNAMEMFALGSKYDMIALMKFCEELIMENIDDSNAIEVFNVGHLFDSSDMKALALNEIKRMHPELTLTNEVLKNPRKMLKILGLVEVEGVKNEKATKVEEEAMEEHPPAKKRKTVVQTCTVKEETKEQEHEELQTEKRQIRRPKRFLN
jgi:BTB/POZ domain